MSGKARREKQGPLPTLQGPRDPVHPRRTALRTTGREFTVEVGKRPNRGQRWREACGEHWA